MTLFENRISDLEKEVVEKRQNLSSSYHRLSTTIRTEAHPLTLLRKHSGKAIGLAVAGMTGFKLFHKLFGRRTPPPEKYSPRSGTNWKWKILTLVASMLIKRYVPSRAGFIFDLFKQFLRERRT